MSKNPRGFPERLRLLMEGHGYNSRTLSRAIDGAVSHATIENWLADRSRAEEGVGIVADHFGWTVDELYFGQPLPTTLNRVAELEGALATTRRSLSDVLGALSSVSAAKLAIDRQSESVQEMDDPPPRRRRRGSDDE